MSTLQAPEPSIETRKAAAISAVDVRKSFDDNVVLDGVSLTVEEGTVFALLGPNGAGKTTMVRILATLLEPDHGDIRVAGHDVAREADDVLYARELERIGVEVVLTYTRRAPRDWTGYTRRVDRAMLQKVALFGGRTYICGPTTFVETVAKQLVALGEAPAKIRTERFGGG